MDPLSLASGISGLIKAADKIASSLSGFTANMIDAPNLARNVVSETQSLSLTLLQLQPLLSPHHSCSNEEKTRRSMVFVDQLVLTVAACIRSLAELEKELDGVVGVGMLDRLKWTVRETGIRQILEVLQMHKSSLTLVLTILTARENREAERMMERLGILVEQVAETNRELVDRIAKSAGRTAPPLSPLSPLSPAPPPPQQQRRSTLSAPATATANNTKRRSAISEINITPWVKFSFEAILQKTKAYRNSKRTSSFLHPLDTKTTTTTTTTTSPTTPAPTTPMSQLSALSLAQVSNLAIVELPIWPDDISGESSRHYDFRIEVPIILLPDDTSSPTEVTSSPTHKSPPPLSLRLLPTPPHTPRTPTHCDSPLPPLPTDDCTPRTPPPHPPTSPSQKHWQYTQPSLNSSLPPHQRGRPEQISGIRYRNSHPRCCEILRWMYMMRCYGDGGVGRWWWGKVEGDFGYPVGTFECGCGVGG
ncbi:hypothetical protein BDD12DRAFT_872810 [Trichophaea hybrida]|nr:hypothetical protein BDD12DRAFT_872810 [Trichophaea hybrida]